MTMTYIVTGLFDDSAEARAVIEDLENNNFNRSDISVIANNAGGPGDQGTFVGDMADLINNPRFLTVSGIGPAMAVGPLGEYLGGDEGGTAGRGIVEVLQQNGVQQDDAQFYAEGIRRGGALVAVSHCTDETAQPAAEIMRRNGAVDIGQRGAWYRQAGFDRFAERGEPYTEDQIRHEREQLRTQEQIAIPVIEEELQVGKREVQRGGARVYSHITEEPVEEQIRLREERVTVDRVPVDRLADEADMAAFREGTFEVTETREEPMVAKEARVVEEVVVSKEEAERVATVRDTVRRTDVEVQPMGGRDVTAELEEDEDLTTREDTTPRTGP